MLYKLSDHIQAAKALDKLQKAIEKQSVIEITVRTKRTLQQNKYLHVILSYFGCHFGYTLQESKELFKRLSKDIFIYKKNGMEFKKSSANLSTEELSKTIDRFRNWSLENGGLYIPEANEQQLLQEIEIEVSQNRYL